jgi:hypothetical protein
MTKKTSKNEGPTMARLAVLISVTVSFLVTSCSRDQASRPEPSPPRTLSAEEIEQSGDPFEKFFGAGHVGLLAVKYQLPEDRVRSIINAYRLRQDFLYRALLGAPNEPAESTERVADTLHQLQQTYGVPEATIAQLLLDYQAWRACSERSASAEDK